MRREKSELLAFGSSRRDFLGVTATALVAGVPAWLRPMSGVASEPKRTLKGFRFAAIGVGGRGTEIASQAQGFADLVAICDVNRKHAEQAHTKLGGDSVEIYDDYRRVLDRKDIDVVTIGTRDHWHAKIAIDGMLSGKDVYCEKPLTLTIEEGRQIAQAVRKTKRVLQVGTQQRSEYGGLFLKAVALVRDGRIGKVREVVTGIGGAPQGGPFVSRAVPPHLNWDIWLGQAPLVSYCPERCDEGARWWYEYSGGQVTNWGAHHVDIAQWAIGMDHNDPVTLSGTSNHPKIPGGYNVATNFDITCVFPNEVKLIIRDNADNGILFEGETGRFFVNREKLVGKPVERLVDDPLPDGLIRELYRGREPGSHMRNFFECVEAREQPISDVHTHNHTMNSLHLANICIRLGRSITWDAASQQVVNDAEANSWQRRDQRKGYEIKV